MKKIIIAVLFALTGIMNVFSMCPVYFDRPTESEKELVNSNIKNITQDDICAMLQLITDDESITFLAAEKKIIGNTIYVFGKHKQIKALAFNENKVKVYLNHNRYIVYENVKIDHQTKELIYSLPDVCK